MPGVHAVITGQATCRVRFGIIPWTEDEQALCETKARYVGDAIAAVAADSEWLAEEALRAIRVDYEALPAVLTSTGARPSGTAGARERRARGTSPSTCISNSATWTRRSRRATP